MKRRLTVLTILILVISIVGSAAYGESVKVENEYDYKNKNNKIIKERIDIENKIIKGKHKDKIITDNGVVIYISEDISEIDKANRGIVRGQEIMRRKVEKGLNEYNDITYPIVSEVYQYGNNNNYYKHIITDEYFSKKSNKSNKNNLVEYDFFKQVDIKTFKDYIEVLDFLDLRNTQIIFNPYRTFKGFGYYENTAPEKLNIRRSRIYINPNDGEDIISTLYHELGHMIYTELVENSNKNYKEYYDIYRREFDTHNASNMYETPWRYKLTENFAEDFKIYLSNKVIHKDKALSKFIIRNEKSFLVKDTEYEIKPEVEKYFDMLLKQQNINTGKYRPDIYLKLDDYKESFKLYNSSYINQHSNKIVTNSNRLKLEFDGEETKINPLKYTLRELDRETYRTINEKELKIKGKDKLYKGIEIRIKGKKIYELDILLGDEEGKYTENVRYYIIKER